MGIVYGNCLGLYFMGIEFRDYPPIASNNAKDWGTLVRIETETLPP